MTKRKEIAEKLLQKDILEEFREIVQPIIEGLNNVIEKIKHKKTFKIALISHTNPDADATSSLFTLKRYLLSRLKKEEAKRTRREEPAVEIFASGDSFPRETIVMMNRIGIKINPLEEFNKKEHRAVILVDVASVKQSNLAMENIEPDLVIDHHGSEDPFGSTATIVTLLMDILDPEILNDEKLVTALSIGIEIDTNNRTSEKFSKFDALAYRKLLDHLIDDQLRKEIIKCGYSNSYREMLTNATSSNKYYHREGSTVISGVGYIEPKQRTGLAKIADFLLDEEGVEKVVVLAIVEDEIRDGEGNIIDHEKFIIPATRSSTGTQNAHELNEKVFGKNVAGGDAVKASGEVPLDFEMIKRIERAKKDKNEKILEGYFLDILNRYKEIILEEQTE